jgi:hypothetical protein
LRFRQTTAFAFDKPPTALSPHRRLPSRFLAFSPLPSQHIVAMTKQPFPIYDERNPKHYERRAGYPLPDSAWYRNTNDDGDHVPMTFSKENFVRGFNITCGEYYVIRDALVTLLHQDDFYKKDLHKDMNAKYKAWEIWEKMFEHALLQHPVPLKWRHNMLWKWISGTSSWIERHKDALDNGDVPDKGWEWGPDRLTPKNAPPHIQFQHIKIRVITPDEVAQTVSVISLLDGDEKRKPSSPVDLNPGNIRITHLHELLKQHDFPHYTQLTWQDPDGDETILDQDIDLVTALSRFQLENRGHSIDEMSVSALCDPSDEDEERVSGVALPFRQK